MDTMSPSMVDEVKEENKMEEEEVDKEVESLNSALKLIILESLGKCWPYGSDIQEKYLYQTAALLADNLYKTTWTNQVLLVKSLGALFSK